MDGGAREAQRGRGRLALAAFGAKDWCVLGQIRTRRWNDPAQPGDGLRLLVCRYRPRGVAKADETWDEWWPDLGPSRALHAAYWGKGQEPIGWPAYRQRYLEE